MRNPVLSWCVLLVVWLGVACAARPPLMQAWEAMDAARCAAPGEDHCVVLGCEEGVCGLFACEDVRQSDTPATSSVSAPAAGHVLALRPGFPMGSARPGRWWRRAHWLRQGAEPVMTFRWYPERPPLRPPPVLPAPQLQKHHLFPQAPTLSAWFKERGINIHDYTILIPTHVHRRIHGGGASGGLWNEAWRQFIETRGNKVRREDIFRHAGELIYRFELTGPVLPYFRRAP
ncbi:SitA6 family polymorphic toxin lipoprotein [Myxococcus sp. NMCA1]|uniref:SitA6 family polymorphic toxin lipoprotein n=1 Tax=Myxococcus sp. NMCA1 TaxID=2996785 RepID=UPI0022861231|nr:TIGR02269 family lipoprotein [Myxococcus sp. NMCA1]WAM26050.1 TIGR02269 family lipoprotein [Myxococcus sp. NMCA1]